MVRAQLGRVKREPQLRADGGCHLLQTVVIELDEHRLEAVRAVRRRSGDDLERRPVAGDTLDRGDDRRWVDETRRQGDVGFERRRAVLQCQPVDVRAQLGAMGSAGTSQKDVDRSSLVIRRRCRGSCTWRGGDTTHSPREWC